MSYMLREEASTGTEMTVPSTQAGSFRAGDSKIFNKWISVPMTCLAPIILVAHWAHALGHQGSP
jgi:hypothetical protein